MVQLGLIENFAVALLLGLIVGLEREFQHQKEKRADFAGARTFILIALFGWLVGFIAHTFNTFTFVIFGLTGMVLLTIAAYTIVAWKKNRIGLTTPFSSIIVFLLAIFVAYNYILIAVISAILMATVLSYKYSLHAFAKKLHVQEVHAGLKLGIISLVILPILPNKAYSPVDVPLLKEIIAMSPQLFNILQQTQIFNPFKIWLIIVFICALSTVGYILIKVLGVRKGIGITGAIGGLVSSTAVTNTMSEISKKSKWYYTFAFSVIIAWTIMFFRVLFIILVLNKDIFSLSLIPIGLMTLASICCAIFLYFKRTPQGKKQEHAVGFSSPFALAPALKFGLFFIGVLFIAKILQALFGSAGIYVASIFIGLADVDPIAISLATLASAEEITSSIAVVGITLAVISNTIVKCSIAFLFGGKEFAKYILYCTGIILATGLISLFLL